jgi:hypothetical protein
MQELVEQLSLVFVTDQLLNLVEVIYFIKTLQILWGHEITLLRENVGIRNLHEKVEEV